uniref:Death-associated protein 1 n=1 Tax=Strigamia maritima TaxID=126957 RepID=T1J5L1_STRMM
MSSSEDIDLKAGHPPAVKAGGKRITQHKPPSERERHDSKSSDKGSGDDNDEEVQKPPSPPKQQLLISGAPARGDADFPTQAVQATHVKPLAAHEFRASSQKPSVIQQPRK